MINFAIRLLLPLVIVLAAGGVALAEDNGAHPDAPQSLAALWPMIGLAIANIAAYGTRKLSASYSFFHTSAGSFVLGLVGAIISAAVPIVQAHGFVWASLAWAAVGAATSFIATLNPSTTAENPPAKSPMARRRGLSDSALVVLMAVGAMGMLTGCPAGSRGAAFGNSMAACELGQLPSTLETVIADVAAILFSGGQTWQSDLEGLGYKLAPGQLDCVVQAVGASVKGKVRHGQVSESYAEAARRADAWMARGKRSEFQRRQREGAVAVGLFVSSLLGGGR